MNMILIVLTLFGYLFGNCDSFVLPKTSRLPRTKNSSGGLVVLQSTSHLQHLKGLPCGKTVALKLVMGRSEMELSDPVFPMKHRRVLVDNYRKQMNGRHGIQRILIANNGVSSPKAILSMKQWVYDMLGDEKAVEFVVMDNRDLGQLAETFIDLPSGSELIDYSNIDSIVNLAVEQKVDAVWPGWGPACEHPRLPAMLKAKGIEFIGPTSSLMTGMSDYEWTNILAQIANVPVFLWKKESCNNDDTMQVSDYTISSEDDCEEMDYLTEELEGTYPVVLKGVNGKQVHFIRTEEELRAACFQIGKELYGEKGYDHLALSVIKVPSHARPVEVKVVADEQGQVLAVFDYGGENPMSRHIQKLVSHTLPTISNQVPSQPLVKEMEKAAQRLVQTMGHVGVGTVEFLYDPSQQRFFFLEFSPRLQVEHPVTLGSPALQLNLPVVQWHIAMGVALDRIPDIRKLYGRNAVADDNADDRINFMEEEYRLSLAIDKKLEVDKSSQVVASLEKENEALKKKIDIIEKTQRSNNLTVNAMNGDKIINFPWYKDVVVLKKPPSKEESERIYGLPILMMHLERFLCYEASGGNNGDRYFLHFKDSAKKQQLNKVLTKYDINEKHLAMIEYLQHYQDIFGNRPKVYSFVDAVSLLENDTRPPNLNGQELEEHLAIKRQILNVLVQYCPPPANPEDEWRLIDPFSKRM